MFTWKFNLENPSQGHGQGQRSRTYSGSNNQSTHTPFVSNQSALPLLGYGYFTIWLFKSKVTIVTQGHMIGSTSNQLKSILSHVNGPFHLWNAAFIQRPDLETPRWSSWERSKLKATKCAPLPIDSHPFSFMLINYPVNVIWLFQYLTLKIQGQSHKPMMLHNYRFRQ